MSTKKGRGSSYYMDLEWWEWMNRFKDLLVLLRLGLGLGGGGH